MTVAAGTSFNMYLSGYLVDGPKVCRSPTEDPSSLGGQ